MIRLFTLIIIALLIASPVFASPSNKSNCTSCHADQVKSWQQSDHAHAMAVANNTSVLGNFNDVTVTHYSQTARFYQDDNRYLIDFTEQGSTTTYQVENTFGHYPLQQYLIRTHPDRLQVFAFSYDTRSKQEGGQRWYPNYANEDIQPNDRLHWLQPLQNYNGMCADCHSDGLTRNFDPNSHQFDTQHDSINVGCKSCHTPEQPIQDTCIACHSLRSPLTDGLDTGTAFFDQFTPSFLNAPMYHADGQIKEEVFVYGSFMQSKMYAQGVTCSNCHDAHTAKIKIEGNGLCLQCHQGDTYQQPNHLNHSLSSEGAQCVSCHMPETTYMGVDARRDHSFSIARPHLSDQFDTPNACTKCHQDKTNQWAAKQVVHWYGKPNQPSAAQAAYMQLQHQQTMPLAQHLALASNTELPDIKRATVISMLPQSTAGLSDQQLRPFYTSDSKLIRLAAAQIGHLLTLADRQKGFSGLLNDPNKAIRVAATNQMLDAQLPTHLIQELAQSQLVNTWRGEANLNRSLTLGRLGEPQQAKEALQNAIKLDPYFDAAYIHLAEHYRGQGQLDSELVTLDNGITQVPTSAALQYAKGMQLIRAGDRNAAVAAFDNAVKLNSAEPQYAYLYTLALDATGQTTRALAWLKQQAASYRYNGQLMQLGMSLAQKQQDLNSYLFFKELSSN